MDKVWETIADDIWVCQVVRTADYQGRLTVSLKADPSKVILDESVGLSYGSIFGPDVGDVAVWQEKCLGAIDAQ